jgi:MATE family multidrug resistance protein
MGVIGFWWGLCLAIFSCSIFLLTSILRTDWKKDVEECQQRIINEDLYAPI